MIAAEHEAWRAIAGDTSRVLIVADHASARVPGDIVLGVPAAMLSRHVAIDIGVAPLTTALCARLGCAAILGNVSRLVCDYNRDEEAPGVLPLESDGVAIPGNRIDSPAQEERFARFFRPYHAAVAAAIQAQRPHLLVSLHSFTPRLETRPDEMRPWQIGILHNRDDRAARIALPLLAARGIVTGDNQPYSGRVLNATMNRHGEANGIPYLGIEVRQDLIADASGVERWTARLAPVIVAVRDATAQFAHDGSRATA